MSAVIGSAVDVMMMFTAVVGVEEIEWALVVMKVERVTYKLFDICGRS